jgi:hypothetical protein
VVGGVTLSPGWASTPVLESVGFGVRTLLTSRTDFDLGSFYGGTSGWHELALGHYGELRMIVSLLGQRRFGCRIGR